MLWLFPFWWLAMVEPLQRARFKGHMISLLLLALSAGTTFWSLSRPWKPSWIYEQMEDARAGSNIARQHLLSSQNEPRCFLAPDRWTSRSIRQFQRQPKNARAGNSGGGQWDD
ncbi:MAG: hypothetical protein U0996_06775 [Planctomycetaceae bacterium]